jgi:hypothetical protein
MEDIDQVAVELLGQLVEQTDNISTRNGQTHFKVYDPVNDALLQESLDEVKDLNKNLKVFFNKGI